MLSFQPGFSLSSFTLTKGLFSSSLLSAIRVVSSANVRLLIFLLAIFIPAWDSSSPTFYLMYSVNKQGDKIQLWCTPFPIWNQSIIPCPVLAVASGPAYRFLKRWVRWSGIPRGPRGATPCSRSGGAAVRRYSSSKVRSSSWALLEQPQRDTPRPR